MLEEFVKTVVRKQIKTEFPHLELPATMYARITKRVELAEYYEYNIKVLDEHKQIDENFPEIPHVKSRQGYKVNDVVAILMLYGKNNPYIVGEVV